MRKRVRKPSPAMGIALLAVFVALGGTTYAATGGSFVLGQPNTAEATSALRSGVTTGQTLNVTNTGGKPAAKFTSNAGIAPFAVSNGAKVANLNVDKLDGLDSGTFVQGKGRMYVRTVAVTRTDGFSSDINTPSPPVAPGFLNIRLACPQTSNGSAPLLFLDDLANSQVNWFIHNDVTPDTVATTSDFPNIVTTDKPGDLTTITANGLPGGEQTTAMVQVATVEHVSDCYFQIQAFVMKQ